ncbi:MAG: hypothetical protein LBM04_05110 [Opitutaceae bacterium]|nr:hypothetical protein [Opitutaceae bacterium]
MLPIPLTLPTPLALPTPRSRTKTVLRIVAHACAWAMAMAIAIAMAVAATQLPASPKSPAPPKPSAPPPPAGSEVVMMDAFEVSAAKHQWRYAQSPHFEILSSVNDVKLVTQIIRRAGQIIDTFQKGCALFRPKHNRPVRLIFINDGGIERFLTFTGKDALQTARDRPPVGVIESSRRKGHVRQISARGYHDDEQIILLKLIPQKYLDGATPFDERVRENALDLAINYLLVCADTHIRPGDAPWLASTLNSMRGHSAGGAPWRLPDNFESPAYGLAGDVFARPAWFTINDEHMSVGRYCLACETRTYRGAGDFPRGESEEAIVAQKKTWGEFLPSPRAGLRAALEQPVTLTHSKKNTTALVGHELCKQREALDFVYYCVFNADPKIRAAFAKFATNPGRQPPDEKLFERCFGADYETFHEKIYAFYRGLARNGGGGNSDYKNNPWGPPAITVAKYSNKDIPKPVLFRNAKRSETSLIVSDWFALCKAGELARQTLIKAGKESEQARTDPEIAAALALAEVSPDAKGDKLKALAMLEWVAAEGKTTRPRVYCTLSRMLLEEIFEMKGRDYRLAASDVRGVIGPLITALKLPGPPPRVYVQFASVWKHTDIKPPGEYLEIIVSGCRRFPGEMELLEEAIPLLAANGHQAAARQLEALRDDL